MKSFFKYCWQHAKGRSLAFLFFSTWPLITTIKQYDSNQPIAFAFILLVLLGALTGIVVQIYKEFKANQ
jgi:hypothetical protein